MKYLLPVSLAWAAAFFVSLIVLIVVAIRNRHEPRGESAVVEFIHVLPFAIWTICPNVVHLILLTRRPVSASVEVIVFAAWWYFVFQWNMNDPRYCWTRVLGSFAVCIPIMVWAKGLSF